MHSSSPTREVMHHTTSQQQIILHPCWGEEVLVLIGTETILRIFSVPWDSVLGGGARMCAFVVKKQNGKNPHLQKMK